MKLPSIKLLPSAAAFVACAAVLGPSSARAVVTYAPGDLLLGFHTNGPVGTNSSLVFNLGSSVGFRNNPPATIPSNNLGTALSDTFGLNWFSRTDLYWGIAGVRDSASGGPNTVVNGDPRAAIYISRETLSPNTSLLWDLGNSGATSSATLSAAAAINDAQLAFIGKTEAPNTGARGIIQAEDVTPNSWNKLNPVGGAAFGGILTGGVQGALGGGAVEYLDLYRVLGRSSDLATPNSAAGEGTYVTTFAIDSTGTITAVPEPTGALLVALSAFIPFFRRRRA